MPLIAALPVPKAKLGKRPDLNNSGVRLEIDLPVQEEIVPKPKEQKNEFEFRDGDNDDDDAIKTQRLQDIAQNNARRASLDPGDGIEL